MISYSGAGVAKVFQISGSVFPSALMVAMPCVIISVVLKWAVSAGYVPIFEDPDSIIIENQAFAGFSFLVGFLVVFRTSQAYSRFWEGSSATHKMRAEWFDAASSLVAFCRHTKADKADVSTFENTLIRLFSMLHACSLAELEIVNTDVEEEEGPRSYQFDMVDPGGLDRESLQSIAASDCKVELIFSWIQFLIVEGISSGILSIPPPLLSRSFQELANGMVAFHEAIKIAYIPFPFPYAQTCDFLLIVHWIVIPFVTLHWVSHPAWAGVFTLMQVFIIWALNFIAVEIENPFGADDNDLDGERMQVEMNRQLVLLVQKRTSRAPHLNLDAVRLEQIHNVENIPSGSFKDLFTDLGDEPRISVTSKTSLCPGDGSQPRGSEGASRGSDVLSHTRTSESEVHHRGSEGFLLSADHGEPLHHSGNLRLTTRRAREAGSTRSTMTSSILNSQKRGTRNSSRKGLGTGRFSTFDCSSPLEDHGGDESPPGKSSRAEAAGHSDEGSEGRHSVVSEGTPVHETEESLHKPLDRVEEEDEEKDQSGPKGSIPSGLPDSVVTQTGSATMPSSLKASVRSTGFRRDPVPAPCNQVIDVCLS